MQASIRLGVVRLAGEPETAPSIWMGRTEF
jgi:hypothetical protein